VGDGQRAPRRDFSVHVANSVHWNSVKDKRWDECGLSPNSEAETADSADFADLRSRADGLCHLHFVPDESLRQITLNSLASVICGICEICGYLLSSVFRLNGFHRGSVICRLSPKLSAACRNTVYLGEYPALHILGQRREVEPAHHLLALGLSPS
jgi:hypothetical protein